MRGLALVLLLGAAAAPTATAGEPPIDIWYCPVQVEFPSAYVCVVTWDDPAVLCIEYHVGSRFDEICGNFPEVPPELPFASFPQRVCAVDQGESQLRVCWWTNGHVDEGCVEVWIQGEFRGTCYTLPVPG
jgi:hypothetical protein